MAEALRSIACDSCRIWNSGRNYRIGCCAIVGYALGRIVRCRAAVSLVGVWTRSGDDQD